MPWPLEAQRLRTFARGKERLLVVEHKRAFMEPQIKDALYSLPDGQRPQVFGKRTPTGGPFLSEVLELKPQDLVQAPSCASSRARGRCRSDATPSPAT